MCKLFNVSVKLEKSSRERKWSVFRYAVVAETAGQAEQMVKDERAISKQKAIDVYATEIEGGLMGRDNYLADNGNPFKREPKSQLVQENPLFAEE
jgi:hypothetical protein